MSKLRNQSKQFNTTLFEDKRMFFYDNAIEIIESKDVYNKFTFLDVLENSQKGKKTLRKTKPKEIKETQMSEAQEFKENKHTSKGINISPDVNNKKSLIRKNLLFEEIKSQNNINKIDFHLPNQPHDDLLTSRFTNKINLSSLNNSNSHFNHNTTSKSLKLRKHFQSAEKINVHLDTLSKFNDKLDYNIREYKNTKMKIDLKSLIYPEFKTSDDISAEIKKKLYDPKTAKILTKMQEDRYGKETIESRIKRIKYSIEKIKRKKPSRDEIDEKVELAVSNNSPHFKRNFRKIGNTKVLKVPEPFSQNFDDVDLDFFKINKCQSMINVNDVKEVYKVKKGKELLKETFFDNLSNSPCRKPKNKLNLTDKFQTFKQSARSVENSNIKIKNQILTMRKKMQASSRYINPKNLVTLEKLQIE